MIQLFTYVDVETSGLWRGDLEVEDPSQPRIVQLAVKTVDQNRVRVGGFDRLIKPDGWTIEPEAEKVHGISERRAHEAGIPIVLALAELKMSVPFGAKIVGFNIFNFDYQVILSELHRQPDESTLWWRRRLIDVIDVMEMAAPVLKLPNPKMPGEPKFPTLQEAVSFFAKDSFSLHNPWLSWEQKHRGVEDNEACEFVHWRIKDGDADRAARNSLPARGG